MEQKEKMLSKIENFRLPGFNEIPDVGLFLEQTTKYISNILAPLEGVTITSSMISNYVKRKLIKNPVKKQYDREQIAYLIFIAVAKSVLSLENIQLFISLQTKSYTAEIAYEYFCREFESILRCVFERRAVPEMSGTKNRNTELKNMLRNTIITAVHKVYLETFFATLDEETEE